METIEQISQKREVISKYDQQTLEMMTIPALKKMASGILPGHSKMKKTELISGLIAATKPERVLAVMVPDTPLDVIETNTLKARESAEVNEELTSWTKSLYKEFREVIQANWDGSKWNERIHGDIAALAHRIMRFLDNQQGSQDDGGTAFTTKLRNRTRICNLLTDLVRSETGAIHYPQMESCLEILKRQIRFQIKDITNQKKGLQERRLAVRKKEKITVSFKPILEFSQAILRQINDMKPSEWRKVSIALAIATGRRMAEIHLDSTKFEYVNKTTCKFTGQLKVKGGAEEYFTKNPSYEIPVLVDAQLVVNGHEWLKAKGKTVLTTQAANTRYSKDLSDTMKALKNKLGIEHNFFTYKGLRTIYAQVANHIFNKDDRDNMLYLAQILGHGRGELLRSCNLTDVITPQSYNSDFIVVDIPEIVALQYLLC